MPVSHRSPDTHNAACGIETTPNPLRCTRDSAVPTHIMPRAALKLLTEDARCDIADVPTHIMPRAVLTAKRLCVSFRSHRAVFVCKKRTAILTMRRTDVRIEIQKGHCRAVAPIISRDSPAKVCSARRGHLFYRLTDIISTVNTTINPLDRRNVKGILLSALCQMLWRNIKKLQAVFVRRLCRASLLSI